MLPPRLAFGAAKIGDPLVPQSCLRNRTGEYVQRAEPGIEAAPISSETRLVIKPRESRRSGIGLHSHDHVEGISRSAEQEAAIRGEVEGLLPGDKRVPAGSAPPGKVTTAAPSLKVYVSPLTLWVIAEVPVPSYPLISPTFKFPLPSGLSVNIKLRA